MADDATTEGSIVGKLRLDISDWEAKLEQAEVKARELGQISPDVRVKADTAEALAKLEAVREAAAAVGGVSAQPSIGPAASPVSAGAAAKVDEVSAAEARLAAAVSASDTAYARAELAQMRLNETREKGITEGSRFAAAQLAVTEALKRLDAANDKATASEAALSAAQAKASESAVVEAASQFELAEATNEASDAHKLNVSRIGLIITAVAALIPILGPLVGYVAGVGGAFAGMASAGVLAVLGIKHAMDQGTVSGAAYSAGLQTLNGDLNRLESTAANVMLFSFQQAVALINADMPELNSQVGVFSQQLGVVGNSVLAGVINSLHVLNPLFVTSGKYVEQLGAGFQSWTANGGLQKFADYASRELPQVSQTLGALATAGLNIVTSFAPVGTVTLSVLRSLASVIDVLVSGPMPELIGAFGAGLLVYKAWNAALGAGANVFNSVKDGITGMSTAIAAHIPLTADEIAASATYTSLLTEQEGVIAAVAAGEDAMAVSTTAAGAAFDFATGPIGIVLAALGGIAVAFGASGAAANASTEETDNYTTALIASHGAINQSIRDMTAKALSDNGALATAKEYHLALSTVTDAALGNAKAQQQVTDAVNKYGTEQRVSNAAQYESGQTTTELTSKAQSLLDVVNTSNGSLTQGIQNQKDYAAASRISANADGSRIDPLKQAADAENKLVSAQKDALTAAQNYAAFISAQNNDALSLDQANTTLAGSYQTLASTVTSNLKSMSRAQATSLDTSTATGLQNHQNIATAIQDAEAQAAAVMQSDLEQGDSKTKATNDSNANLARSKQAIIDHATQAGLDAGAVQTLINTLLKVPPDIKTVFTLTGVAEGKQQLSDYLKLVSSIHDITQRITVEATYVGGAQNLATTGNGYVADSGGGKVPSYLAGGGNGFVPVGTDTVPAMLTPKEFVVRASSAEKFPQFIKAFNDNPESALDQYGGKQKQTVVNNYFTIYEATNADATAQMVAHYLAGQAA